MMNYDLGQKLDRSRELWPLRDEHFGAASALYAIFYNDKSNLHLVEQVGKVPQVDRKRFGLAGITVRRNRNQSTGSPFTCRASSL